MTTTDNNKQDKDKDDGNVFIKHLGDKLDEVKEKEKDKK